MAPRQQYSLQLFILFTFFLHFSIFTKSQSFIGVNYGQVADNLPAPEATAKLLQSTSIGKVRMYGADPAIIRALANTGIGIVIGAANGDIPALASDPNYATQWVNSNVLAYPDSNIIVITVGNEVMTAVDQSLVSLCLPAMQNVQNALNAVYNKDNKIYKFAFIRPINQVKIKESGETNMTNWMFCSTSVTKHMKLQLKICELEGLAIGNVPNKDTYKLQVHIKLGVPRKGYVPRMAIQKDHTSKQCIDTDGRVCWNEGFEQRCSLDMKHISPKSWKINLEVHGIDVESTHKADILAKVNMDVNEFIGGSEKPVKLPVQCGIGSVTHEAQLKVKLHVIEVQKLQTKNTVHPVSVSPTHLLPALLSCVNFQNQTKNKMEIEKESSQSENEEEADPTYQRIKTINLFRSQSSHESIEYRKHGQHQISSYEGVEKRKLTRLFSWNTKKSKDAPLLNKAYGEGGDDIDNARRTLLSYLKPQNDLVKTGFKDNKFTSSDRFEVGKWEKKRVNSRDGKLELQTEIFLATIDQRSEKALGEGACTVIATVITDWLHLNPNSLPLKCEFDKLIRDGSREWRNLCQDETHKGKFLDQHFDLDTVMQAQVRPLMVVSEKSYVGFFKLENTNKLDLLQDAMSFDSIWDELQNGESTSEGVYIVSWNDHFFVLKIEKDTMYIIDTLGERLVEGCDKAYILKFNEDSVIRNVQPLKDNSKVELEEGIDEERNSSEFVCKGTTCCKEFIKGFLAAIPLRELQSNVEKGINGKAPLHQLLQIEFHYMSPLQQN